MANLSQTDLMELARHAKSLGLGRFDIKGGAGSGNHGHAGRKGKRGGSATRTGTGGGTSEATALASGYSLGPHDTIVQTDAAGNVVGEGKIVKAEPFKITVKWSGNDEEFTYPRDAVNAPGGGGLQGIHVKQKSTDEGGARESFNTKFNFYSRQGMGYAFNDTKVSVEPVEGKEGRQWKVLAHSKDTSKKMVVGTVEKSAGVYTPSLSTEERGGFVYVPAGYYKLKEAIPPLLEENRGRVGDWLLTKQVEKSRKK